MTASTGSRVHRDIEGATHSALVSEDSSSGWVNGKDAKGVSLREITRSMEETAAL